MLDPWIIEEIKRKEREHQEQPVIQIPSRVPERDRDPRENGKHRDEKKEPPRGVEIIDFDVAYGW